MASLTPAQKFVLCWMDRGFLLRGGGMGKGELVNHRSGVVAAQTHQSLIRRRWIRKIMGTEQADTFVCDWCLTEKGLAVAAQCREHESCR